MARGRKAIINLGVFSPFPVALSCLCFTTARCDRKKDAYATQMARTGGDHPFDAGLGGGDRPPGIGLSPRRPDPVQPGGPVSSLSMPGMPSGTVTRQITGPQPGRPRRRPKWWRPEWRRPELVAARVVAARVAAAGIPSSPAATGPDMWRAAATARFASASSNWTEPVGRLHVARSGRYAAFWVGLDGYTSNTVEQIGPKSTAPAPACRPRSITPGTGLPGRRDELHQPGQPRRPVHRHGHLPGPPRRSGSCSRTSHRAGRRRSPPPRPGADLSSAEAIAEAPSEHLGRPSVLPLTDFGSVNFTRRTANGTSLDTLDPVQSACRTPRSRAWPATEASSVTYAGTSGNDGFPRSDFAPWFGSYSRARLLGPRRWPRAGGQRAAPARPPSPRRPPPAASNERRAAARPGWGCGRRSRSA